MSDLMAEKFIAALTALEGNRDTEPLVALYADDASAGNLLAPDRFHGAVGAREFWTEYRGTFQDAKSEFRNIVANEDCAALEWTTQGTSLEEHAIRYSGVTILEFANGKIIRSCAYFNPSDLGRQIEQK